MALPVCPTGCADVADALPNFTFSECAPEVNGGEIRRIFLGIPGHPFTDWKSATEWTTRLAAAAGAPTRLIAMTVTGDKPKPTGESKAISGGRTTVLEKTHTINADVDETNDANHEAFRKMECGAATYSVWYETAGGKMFGGNTGISLQISPDMVIPRGSGDSILWSLVLSWKAKFTEEMTTSPLA